MQQSDPVWKSSWESSNMFWESEQVGMIDSMLAGTGYAVVESELPQLADRIEELESLMGASGDGDISRLSTDTVHSNPSDIAKWIDSLIELTKGSAAAGEEEEADPPPSTVVENSTVDDDCFTFPNANPGISFHGGGGSSSSSSLVQNPSPAAALPVLMVDDEASGVRLVQLLLACAASVERKQFAAAEPMLQEIRLLAMPDRGPMDRVAMYFAEGLARRIIYAFTERIADDEPPSCWETLHYYEACPYLKFAYFTANEAIFEALQGEKVVHIIDLELGLGLQWPALIQALALRPGGPPLVRLTGIGPPRADGVDALQETGTRLTEFAEKMQVELRFQGVVAAKLADVQSSTLQVRPGEAVAVNSILQLHRLLLDDDDDDDDDAAALNGVLSMVRRLRPKTLTVVEQEASHNSHDFQQRFVEALHFYAAMFDSLEASCTQQQKAMAAEAHLGREICNIVACEGQARVERHERLEQWKQRLCSLGFQQRHLGSNAFNKAATLLTIFPGGGHSVQETGGCLTLGWHSHPLFAASAWQC